MLQLPHLRLTLAGVHCKSMLNPQFQRHSFASMNYLFGELLVAFNRALGDLPQMLLSPSSGRKVVNLCGQFFHLEIIQLQVFKIAVYFREY